MNFSLNSIYQDITDTCLKKTPIKINRVQVALDNHEHFVNLASLVRLIVASVRTRLCNRQHAVSTSSQNAAGWRAKRCLLRRLCHVKMQSQAVKSIPVLAWPNILFRKQLKEEERKKTTPHSSQFIQLNLLYRLELKTR